MWAIRLELGPASGYGRSAVVVTDPPEGAGQAHRGEAERAIIGRAYLARSGIRATYRTRFDRWIRTGNGSSPRSGRITFYVVLLPIASLWN